MAKKAELLEQANTLNLEVTEKNTITEIETALAEANRRPSSDEAPISTEPSSDEQTDDGAMSADADADIDAADDGAHTAKAGKRSDKALKETAEKAAREARKETGDTSPLSDDGEAVIKKGPKPVTRPLIERRGKKYRELAQKIDTTKSYSLSEAVALAAETSPVTFDASVEIHVGLGVDPRQADQNVRATVSLPHGTGKTIRVAAFVASEDAAAATAAGADVAGEDAVTKLLDKQQLDFDILVATPQMMPKLGKFARLLGPRGLMPNPKSGTVATNAAQAVKEAKGGRVEYRVDKQSIVHLSIGKVSFGGAKLDDNAKAFFASLASVKPSSLKGTYIKSVNASTTMGPSVKVDISSL